MFLVIDYLVADLVVSDKILVFFKILDLATTKIFLKKERRIRKMNRQSSFWKIKMQYFKVDFYSVNKKLIRQITLSFNFPPCFHEFLSTYYSL